MSVGFCERVIFFFALHNDCYSLRINYEYNVIKNALS